MISVRAVSKGLFYISRPLSYFSQVFHESSAAAELLCLLRLAEGYVFTFWSENRFRFCREEKGFLFSRKERWRFLPIIFCRSTADRMQNTWLLDVLYTKGSTGLVEITVHSKLLLVRLKKKPFYSYTLTFTGRRCSQTDSIERFGLICFVSQCSQQRRLHKTIPPPPPPPTREI